MEMKSNFDSLFWLLVKLFYIQEGNKSQNYERKHKYHST